MTDSLDTSRQRGERYFAAGKGTTLAEKMREAASVGDPLRFDSPAGRAHVPTKIAERAAATLAITMQRELVLVSPADATLLLARRVIKDLAYHYGFDRMVQALPRESYGHGDLRAVMTDRSAALCETKSDQS